MDIRRTLFPLSDEAFIASTYDSTKGYMINVIRPSMVDAGFLYHGLQVTHVSFRKTVICPEINLIFVPSSYRFTVENGVVKGHGQHLYFGQGTVDTIRALVNVDASRYEITDVASVFKERQAAFLAQKREERSNTRDVLKTCLTKSNHCMNDDIVDHVMTFVPFEVPEWATLSLDDRHLKLDLASFCVADPDNVDNLLPNEYVNEVVRKLTPY